MSKLIQSKYLRIQSREHDYAVYHSLFGHLILLDASALEILNLFGRPLTMYEAVQIHGNPLAWNYANEFRNREFLVREGANEYDRIKSHANTRINGISSGTLLKIIQLVVANKCNFACSYCFMNSTESAIDRGVDRHRPSNQVMAVDTAIISVANILRIFERNNNSPLTIEFFGGEPLMNWPAIEAVLTTFGAGTNGVEIRYSLTTNGQLITDEIANFLAKHEVSVVVSFDFPTTNTSGKGSCVIQNNLDILKKAGVWTTFNSVISKETLSGFDYQGLVRVALSYDIRMIGLILDLDPSFYSDKSNREIVIETVMNTKNFSEKQNIPVVGYWRQIIDQIVGIQPHFLDAGYKTCPATGSKLSVEPGGSLYICKCCSRQLGHTSNMHAFLQSKEYEEYAMHVYRNSRECDGCEIEGFCSGLCMGSIENRHAHLNCVEDQVCEVYKSLTRRLIQETKTPEKWYFSEESP